MYVNRPPQRLKNRNGKRRQRTKLFSHLRQKAFRRFYAGDARGSAAPFSRAFKGGYIPSRRSLAYKPAACGQAAAARIFACAAKVFDARQKTAGYMRSLCPQPCLCLWLLFLEHIIITLPLRLMTLHLSHMGFTEGLTFMILSPFICRRLSFCCARLFCLW